MNTPKATGWLPTGIVVVTVFVVASITDTPLNYVMVKPKYVSECPPTAPLLPFRPGGFGTPLWQLAN